MKKDAAGLQVVSLSLSLSTRQEIGRDWVITGTLVEQRSFLSMSFACVNRSVYWKATEQLMLVREMN